MSNEPPVSRKPICPLKFLCFDALYLAAAVLGAPYFAYRRFIKKKQSAPWSAKLGYAPERAAGARRVWIHAVSVGEAAAAETLVKALPAKMPGVEVVISTTTVTGQTFAAKRYGAERVFYYPYDFSWVVRRILNRIKPTVLVLMESEVWPNLTAEAARRGIPIVVVNGRVTERAARRYRRFWFLLGAAFHRVQAWLVQSDEYVERLKSLGVRPETIQLCGNLKYDAVDTAPPDPAGRQQWRAALGIDSDAPVLIGGSTHPTEEAAVLSAYAQLRRSSCPALRLILVPRHPERAGDVEADVSGAGFAPVRRSAINKEGLAACLARLPAERRDSAVVLIDTVGELKQAYAAADLAFVGGSLIPHGGQNPVEPCGLGMPVLHGPHMHNFNDAMAILRGCQGSAEVTRETLEPTLERMLRDRTASAAMGTRAREAFLKQQVATARVVEYLRGILWNRR